jgi:hypothetical protein
LGSELKVPEEGLYLEDKRATPEHHSMHYLFTEQVAVINIPPDLNSVSKEIIKPRTAIQL